MERLDFADERPVETQDARFRRHDRFLRSLMDDTLLVVDNFNVTASEDSFLAVMLRYRCRILFKTRCRYEEQAMLEVHELHTDTLFSLYRLPGLAQPASASAAGFFLPCGIGMEQGRNPGTGIGNEGNGEYLLETHMTLWYHIRSKEELKRRFCLRRGKDDRQFHVCADHCPVRDEEC